MFHCFLFSVWYDPHIHKHSTAQYTIQRLSTPKKRENTRSKQFIGINFVVVFVVVVVGVVLCLWIFFESCWTFRMKNRPIIVRFKVNIQRLSDFSITIVEFISIILGDLSVLCCEYDDYRNFYHPTEWVFYVACLCDICSSTMDNTTRAGSLPFYARLLWKWTMFGYKFFQCYNGRSLSLINSRTMNFCDVIRSSKS